MSRPSSADSLSAEEKRARVRQLLQKAQDKPRLYPLSFAQQRLWFIDQFEPGASTYVIPMVLRLEGRLDVAVLARCLNEVVARHAALRTTFPVMKGQPVQWVSPTLEVPLPLVDLAVPPQDALPEILRIASEEVGGPFDLARGPLLRTRLLRLKPEEHVLVLVIHHIVADGWSGDVFVRELAALYPAFRAGQPSPLAPLPLQYPDFAVWQRQWLQGEVLQRQLSYWKERLAHAPTLELPADRPRPPVQTYRGARVPVVFSRELTAALRGLGQRQGATLFMTLLAAFQALLQRYCLQDDVVVGTPIANRNRAEIEGLIGFFVNTLALRTDLSGDPDFETLIQRAKEVCLGAYAHQDLPFERLVEALQVERDLSRSPVFQVMLTLQNAPAGPLAIPGLQLSLIDLHSGAAKLDLSLTLAEREDGLRGDLEYNTDLFDEGTVQRMAAHLERLLEAVAARPKLRLSQLPLLSPEERRYLLEEWNATTVALPDAGALDELVARQAERAPDAIALVHESGRLTYGELERGANALAHRLRALGVGPETRVGLFMERSPQVVLGMLGVLKAGGAFVPVDPGLPAARVALQLRDAGAVLVLTQRPLAARASECSLPSVCVEELLEAQDGPATAPARGAHPDSLAYVVYTSGSTGTPKGVMISHRGICNRLLWEQRAHPLTREDAVLQVASYGFDAAIWEIFRALLAGARVVLIAEGGQQDPAYLVRRIAAERVTEASFVPSLLKLLLEEGLAKCQGLKRVVSAGEALSGELAARFAAALPHARLDNFYGQTEVSIDAAYFPCRAGEPHVRVPIGRPLGNMRVHVLDRRLELMPVGAWGELYIAGPGLARGYLGRPELTAERFLPDPYALEPGARLYRTGDVGRLRPDGALEFRDRVDNQVKLRGIRVELSEIEAALRRHPAVKEVVVLVREEHAARSKHAALRELLDQLDPPPSSSSLHPSPQPAAPEPTT